MQCLVIILDHNFTEKGLDLLKNQLVEEVGFSSHHSDQVVVEGKLLLYFQSLQISVIRYFLSFPHLLPDKNPFKLNSKKLKVKGDVLKAGHELKCLHAIKKSYPHLFCCCAFLGCRHSVSKRHFYFH